MQFSCRSARFAIALVASCLLAGCGPGDVLNWAPDGKHALVAGGDEVSLIDATGKILGNAGGATVWMPDSQRAIGVRTVNAKSWEEYANLLGQERAEDATFAGEELLAILQLYKGPWGDFENSKAMKTWMAAHPDALPGVAYYLLEKRRETFAPILKAWQNANESKAEINGPIYELFTRDVLPDRDPLERLLLRSADPLSPLRPSPDGKLVAFSTEKSGGFELQVIPAEGGKPLLVDSGASQADWTPDGERMVYVAAVGHLQGDKDAPRLGEVAERRIRDHSGALLAEFENAERFSTIIFVPGKEGDSLGDGRVACLPDGRILFAALPFRLPSSSKDTPTAAVLFILRPGKNPTIERIVSEKKQPQLPDRADRFRLSPDGKTVAVPGSKGELALVSIATGEITKIQGPVAILKNGQSLANGTATGLLPSWRNATELSYMVGWGAPGGSAARSEVVLRKIGGDARVISKAWPNAMTDAFLPRLAE